MNKIETSLVKDGNSMAVRIPKAALKQSGISGFVELTVTKNKIIIENAQSPRENWAKAIKKDPHVVDKDLADWDALAGEAIDV